MGDSDEQRPKRQKRNSSYKSKAFERFKDIKSGKRNKYADEEIENVYDIVEESEYIKKVVDRQDDDWIVDDDGSGYVEDGRDVFDDDLDIESINAAASTSRGKKRKKKSLTDGKSSGKGKLRYMLSNMPTKKKEETNLNNDDVLSELLEEIDETPNTHQIIKPKPITSGFSTILANKKAEKEYIRNSNKRIEIVDKPKVLKQVLHSNFDSVEKNDDNLQETNDDNIEQEDTTAITVQDDCFNDDLDMTQIDEFNTTADDGNVDNKGQNIDDDDVVENWFSNDFQMANLDDNIETTPVNNDDDDDNETDIFRFYWLDAYEDSNRQPGVVFLFGKTWDDQNKNYSSCCVVVREIERKIYFLPKPFDADTGDEITSQDVYKEINETIMKPLQVKHFKARPIAKKYAFETGIPTESDYIEVRYSARDPAVSSTTQGRTFSRVFGTETSYLEILLLERKIKGPCWLDITNFTKAINPISWCKIEIDCCKLNDINITNYKEKTPPPLIVASINMRRCINPKTLKNEIVMLSCVINQKYFVDKPLPSVPFQKHFCVFTSPNQQMFPMDLHTVLNTFKGTTVQKVDTEKALLNYFIIQLSKIDCDLIVGHDLIGYQMNIISERLCNYELYNNFSKLSRLKRTILIQKKLERELFLGRLVCDIKQTTKELIKCRSYDLNTLCESVLKLNENQRIDLELDDIPKMFQTSNDIIKLIQLTMQDTLYIMKIMYQLNMIPLAIQITNICGNILSKTLLGGRSERNEYLLLHAFYEKNYIVPDKLYNNYNKKKGGDKVVSSKKKPSYSGGLVLEPKVGFYDKLVLLMDFNSLYPSIIQEYNICFTTIPIDLNNEDNVVLPASNLPSGILPTEIRKLVDSRRQVKQLMNMPDLNNDLKQQYNIRQMALKLTANSMYGCLGFTHSRFYAKNLAALITLKGREILTNTRDIVEKMNYNVLYGDTDSLMILTNIIDYDGVFKIGNKIKQEINKLYKQIELDIDGVFKYLLLLKKKKYAAITLTKTPQNELKQTIEYKGLDIVRRDWSQLASQAGKFVLKQIFNDTITLDERINVIMQYLKKLKDDAQENTIPLSLLIITKQLTKNPELYNDKNTQPHVQVALRYNKDYGGHLRSGDTVPYIICDDGTNKPSTQRAYHIEELKNNPSLKIDNNYYLLQQIYPVITRICEPIDGIDDGQIADALGLDITKKYHHQQQDVNIIGENITRPEIKFRNVDQFSFKCINCQFVNTIDGPLEDLPNIPFEKCLNLDCNARPLDYSTNIQNQLIQTINSYIDKYYQYEMYCEDPMCTNETTRLPLNFSGRYPLCTLCNDGVLLKKYTETNLYLQLSYFQYIFDLNKLNKKLILDQQVEKFYNMLKETVDKRLNYCAFSIINLDELFSGFKLTDKDYTFVPDNEDSDVDE